MSTGNFHGAPVLNLLRGEQHTQAVCRASRLSCFCRWQHPCKHLEADVVMQMLSLS